MLDFKIAVQQLQNGVKSSQNFNFMNKHGRTWREREN